MAAKSNSPAGDTRIILGAGEGKIDKKLLAKTAEVWGKLPEKDRAKAIEAIARQYPPHYREAIEGYLREMAKAKNGEK
jgi:hypothetical protein